jgi:hypothetical protein
VRFAAVTRQPPLNWLWVMLLLSRRLGRRLGGSHPILL